MRLSPSYFAHPHFPQPSASSVRPNERHESAAPCRKRIVPEGEMDHQGFGDEDDDAFGQLFGGEEGGPGDLVGDEGPVAAVFEPPQLLDEVLSILSVLF